MRCIREAVLNIVDDFLPVVTNTQETAPKRIESVRLNERAEKDAVRDDGMPANPVPRNGPPRAKVRYQDVTFEERVSCGEEVTGHGCREQRRRQKTVRRRTEFNGNQNRQPQDNPE